MHLAIRVKGDLIKITPQVALELHNQLAGKPVYTHHDNDDHIFCDVELKTGDRFMDQSGEIYQFNGVMHKRYESWVFFWRDAAAALGEGWMKRAEAWRNEVESRYCTTCRSTQNTTGTGIP